MERQGGASYHPQRCLPCSPLFFQMHSILGNIIPNSLLAIVTVFLTFFSLCLRRIAKPADGAESQNTFNKSTGHLCITVWSILLWMLKSIHSLSCHRPHVNLMSSYKPNLNLMSSYKGNLYWHLIDTGSRVEAFKHCSFLNLNTTRNVLC